jgi:hypothetical protein
MQSTTGTVDMITILIMNLLDTLSGVDPPVEPTRRDKRRFNLRQSIMVTAAILLVLALASAPWLAAIPYR